MSFINVLGMCGYIPPTVLVIYDCSEHMTAHEKIDTTYIAQLFEGEIDEFVFLYKYLLMSSSLMEHQMHKRQGIFLRQLLLALTVSMEASMQHLLSYQILPN